MGSLVSGTQEGGGREEARGIRGRDVQVWQVQIHEDPLHRKADQERRRAHDNIHYMQDVCSRDETLKNKYTKFLERCLSVTSAARKLPLFAKYPRDAATMCIINVYSA